MLKHFDADTTLRGYNVTYTLPDRYRGRQVWIQSQPLSHVEIRPAQNNMTHVVGHYGDHERVVFSTDGDPADLIPHVPTHVHQLIRVWRDEDGTAHGHSWEPHPEDDFAKIGDLTTEEADHLLNVLESIPTPPSLNDLAKAALEAKDAVPEGTTPEDHLPYVEAALAYWSAVVARNIKNARAVNQVCYFSKSRRLLIGE